MLAAARQAQPNQERLPTRATTQPQQIAVTNKSKQSILVRLQAKNQRSTKAENGLSSSPNGSDSGNESPGSTVDLNSSRESLALPYSSESESEAEENGGDNIPVSLAHAAKAAARRDQPLIKNTCTGTAAVSRLFATRTTVMRILRALPEKADRATVNKTVGGFETAPLIMHEMGMRCLQGFDTGNAQPREAKAWFKKAWQGGHAASAPKLLLIAQQENDAPTVFAMLPHALNATADVQKQDTILQGFNAWAARNPKSLSSYNFSQFNNNRCGDPVHNLENYKTAVKSDCRLDAWPEAPGIDTYSGPTAAACA